MEGSKHQSEATRRRQILLAADLILIESGTEGFTIDQVAERARIAKGTIYKYFKSKQQILAELSIKSVTLLLETFKKEASAFENSLDKIKAICRAGFHFNNEFPEYYKLISYIERPEFDMDIQGYLRISSSIVAFVVEIIQNGQKNGEIKSTLNPEVVDYILWACCIGSIQFLETKQKLIKKIHDIDINQFIDTFAEMMADGIKA